MLNPFGYLLYLLELFLEVLAIELLLLPLEVFEMLCLVTKLRVLLCAAVARLNRNLQVVLMGYEQASLRLCRGR